MIRRRGSVLLPAILAAAWLLGPGGSAPAKAEPAFAVRTGYSCAQCHVNRTGGGMRTAFGSLYTQTVMPARLLNWREGMNLLPADPDARLGYGGDVHAGYYSTASDENNDSSTFEIPAANLYAQLRVAPERFVIYLDQSVGSGTTASRELFGLWSFRKGNGYVKVGKFVPAFGWELPDDGAFVREPIGFGFTGPDLGIETGFRPGNWSVHLSVVNGNAGARDDDRTKKFVLRTVRRFGKGRIGLSGANNLSSGPTTTWAGLFGGVGFGRFSLLAEGDWRRARPMTTTCPEETDEQETWAGYFEANVLIRRGMNVKYAHDWIDPDRCIETDQRQRDSLGFEYVPYPFVRLRAFVRQGDGPGPPHFPGSKDKSLELEVHLFF